jgi:hypothetical protein
MKRIILPFLCGLILAIISCSSGSDVAFIDKTQKAIVSANGQAFKKVMVQGAGKEVTFQGFSNDQKNSIIYFDKVNPGFLVAEGFGLNKNYVLRLVPGKKYTVYIFTDPKDPSAYPIHFRTDYNNNIITEADEDK